jgi:DNA-directed RNA polymerase specialized sigma24 family protein
MHDDALQRFAEAHREYERAHSQAANLERLRDEALLAVQHELGLDVAELAQRTGLPLARVEQIIERVRREPRD